MNSMGQADASADIETIQRELITIWTDVLRVAVGPAHDFFDLGGDSIAAFEVINCVVESLGVELSIQAIYSHSTIPQLAAEVARLRGLNHG